MQSSSQTVNKTISSSLQARCPSCHPTTIIIGSISLLQLLLQLSFLFNRSGLFFRKSLQVRLGPTLVFQRRTFCDCRCEMFLQAGCPFGHSTYTLSFRELKKSSTSLNIAAQEMLIRFLLRIFLSPLFLSVISLTKTKITRNEKMTIPLTKTKTKTKKY